MPDLPIVPTSVDGAWLVYTVEGAENETYLPLTKFQVRYALDEIVTPKMLPTSQASRKTSRSRWSSAATRSR
jgi:hypothetical protein